MAIGTVLILGVGLSGCGKKTNPATSEPSEIALQKVHSNTKLVIDGMLEEHDVTLKLDDESVLWLDKYINDQRDDLTKDLRDQMVEGFGCFLGDCMIEVYDGRWVVHESQGMCVELKNESIALPFPAAARQLTPGNASSIYAMFTRAPTMGKLGKQEPGPSP